ncbi:unnamed protein product [Protopolystoma xenopodis]|uniref:Uncharacterized protein n=1 Tax=Protopolystoma xenopodis TaxID=117903 RepID=A0A448XJG1_9PLAT|nr:unnamed protein product [Protopolystoma xenopodis]
MEAVCQLVPPPEAGGGLPWDCDGRFGRMCPRRIALRPRSILAGLTSVMRRTLSEQATMIYDNSPKRDYKKGGGLQTYLLLIVHFGPLDCVSQSCLFSRTF